MLNRILPFGVVLMVVLWSGCAESQTAHDHPSSEAADHDHAGHDHAGQDDHEGHDHGAGERHGAKEIGHAEELQTVSPKKGDGHTTEPGHDSHAHEETESDSHDGHGHDEDAGGVSLSAESQKIAGIKIDSVSRRPLIKTIELPGRIGYNEDRLAHISPRYAGIVKSIDAHQGRYVRKGHVLARIESNQSMTTYSIVAPFSGYVLDKRLVPGEHVKEDSQIFVIGDLSRVWVNCDVFASNMDYIKEGDIASIESPSAGKRTKGTISYVAPIFNSETNSGLVRVVLPNTERQWRPGMFVRARISVALQDSTLAVERDAVQILDGETVVFRPGPGNSFINTRVTLGSKGGGFVEIVKGLHEGDAYVSKGAYALKSEIVTSGMDPHAGHGH